MSEAQMFGLLCAVAVLLVLSVRPFLGWLRSRSDARETRRATARWRADNPPDPPLSPEETEAFRAWLHAAALPAVILGKDEGAVAAAGSRIGGPVWLGGQPWPVGRNGVAMEFVAQIDFAQLPPLPDFPGHGLLQFFVANDDLYGADFDSPARGDIHLRWHEAVPPDATLTPPPALDRDFAVSPHASPEVRRSGLALAAKPAAPMPPTAGDWCVDAGLAGRSAPDSLFEWIDGAGAAFASAHHVGGYPAFTQFDFRRPGRGAELDRVLLRLTYDRVLQWGDCGEAAFLIARDDLIARRFERAVFWWDCT